MTKPNKMVFRLHTKQWEAFHCNKQFIAVIAGVQSGKTTLGCLWSQKKINEFPKDNGLIASPSYKMLNQSTLERFFQLFPQYLRYYKQGKNVIELPTGGSIFIRSTDEPLGLEGMTIRWAWLDEAGMMRRLVWQIVRSRVSTTKGQVLITSTPYFLNWLYSEFYMKWRRKEDDDLAVYEWRSIDNPYFPKDYYEKEKQRLSAQEFARRYEGIFTKLSGLVYDFNHTIEPINFTTRDDVIAGVDWGFRNPTAIAIILVKDQVFYVIDEFYEIGKTTDEIIEQAKKFQKLYKVNFWFPDPSEADRIEEMKRAGLLVKKTNRDVRFGISKLQTIIRENRFFVFKTCINTIEEFNLYRYDEESKRDEPIKDNDHLMDAIRYAVVGYLQYYGGTPKVLKIERQFLADKMY